MKAVVLMDANNPEGSVSGVWPAIRASLHGLGIEYDRYIATVAPSAATLSTDYDFVISPMMTSVNMRTYTDDANLTIPIFAFTLYSLSPAQISQNDPGVSGAATSIADNYVNMPWTTSNFMACYGKTWTLAGAATSFITVQATDPRDDSAQTNAGNTMGWHVPIAGAGDLYATSMLTDSQPMLAILLQVAYNNGDFTLAQMKSLNRLPLSVDMDHVCDGSWNTDKDIFDRWSDLIPAGGMSWCGVNNGGGTATDYVDDTLDTIIAVFSKQTNKKMKFSYHEHFAEAVGGTWPSETTTQTKLQQETNYGTLKTAWEARGLTWQNTDGFYVPGNNAWNEATLQLLSPMTSIASDGADTVSQAGWGFKMVRYSTSNVCSRPAPNLVTYPRHVLKQREYMRGMTLVPANDYALGDSLANVAAWRGTLQILLRGIHYGQSIYFHGDDFIDTQDPINGEFGIELMEQLNDLKGYMTETVDVFVDMSEYAI